MSTPARRDRFLRSLSVTERSLFEQMSMQFMAKAHGAGINMDHDEAMRCAAAKVQCIREKGIKAAMTFRVGRVPTDWPDVEEKAQRQKQKRSRKAAPGESEAEIQERIIKYLLQTGWLVIRFNSGAQTIDGRFFRAYIIENTNKSAGVTDVIAFKQGMHHFLEVKTATGTMNENQKAFRDLAEQHGEVVHIVRSVDEVVNIIQRRKAS